MLGRNSAIQAASRQSVTDAQAGGNSVYCMNDRSSTSRLSKAMDRLKAESADVTAPAEIERAVLAEFTRVKQRRKRWSWMVAAGAVSASIAVVLIVEQRNRVEPPASPAAEVEESEQPFVPIPY